MSTDLRSAPPTCNTGRMSVRTIVLACALGACAHAPSRSPMQLPTQSDMWFRSVAAPLDEAPRVDTNLAAPRASHQLG